MKHARARGYHVIAMNPLVHARAVADALCETGLDQETIKVFRKDLRRSATRVRRIFDEEKPEEIRETQSGSLFLWVHKDQIWPVFQKHPVMEISFKPSSRVADAETFLKALATYEVNLRKTGKVMQEIRELARRYWRHSMTFQQFKAFYKREGTTALQEPGPTAWVKTTRAPPRLPKVVANPEILVAHEIRKEDISRLQ